MLANLDKCALTQLIGNESRAVSGDAEETAPGLPLALAQVIGEPGKHVALFQPQVALELEYNGAKSARPWTSGSLTSWSIW